MNSHLHLTVRFHGRTAPREALRWEGRGRIVRQFVLSLVVSIVGFPALAASSRYLAPDAPLKTPLDQIITIKMSSGSLETFFDQVSQKSGLKFRLLGLEKCTVGAFLWNVPVRDVLRITMESHELTYQNIGRPDTYTVAPRHREPNPCTKHESPLRATGTCRNLEGPRISVECANAPLHEFARLVFAYADANFFLWNGAESHPVTARVTAASLGDTMKGVISDKALVVTEIEPTKTYVLRLGRNTAAQVELRENLNAVEFRSALVGKWISVFEHPSKKTIEELEFKIEGIAYMTVIHNGEKQQYSGRYNVEFEREPNPDMVTLAQIKISGDNPIVLKRVNFGLHNAIPSEEGLLLRIDSEPYGALKRAPGESP